MNWMRTTTIALLLFSIAVFGYVLPSRADVEGPRDEYRPLPILRPRP